MRTGCLFAVIGATVLATPIWAALDQPWQRLDDSSLEQAWPNFVSPPPEYGAQFTWGWRGLVTKETILKDLDGIKALGVKAAIIEPQAGRPHP